MLALLLQKEDDAMADLSKLQADVAVQATVTGSAITLLQGLSAAIKAAGTDQAAVDVIRSCDRREAKRLNLLSGPRAPKEKRVRAVEDGVLIPEEPEKRGPRGVRDEVCEFFYEIFSEEGFLFVEHAAFEPSVSILEEYRSALRKGQTTVGFFMGDPLPGRFTWRLSSVDQPKQGSLAP